MHNNKVFLKGNLVADPEMKATPSGIMVATFRIAVKGFKKDRADFFDCSAFGQTGDYICKYGEKGRTIHLWGRIEINDYEKDGVKKTYTRIVCEEADFDSKPTKTSEPSFEAVSNDDALPF
ncbi:MAG: single-stranded DNA-binding protein [Clostridia bacterium]|nr:single-stranded DNA-binding protein [Clostridia bacterium]